MDLGLTPEVLRAGLLFYVLLIACLGLRAYAQAWIADRLGDPTPREEGRLSLNLLVHMDLFGSVILPLLSIFYLQPNLGRVVFFLAWTKPVPINQANFEHPQRGMLFTQFAPAIMSVLLATLAAVGGGFGIGYSDKVGEIVEALIKINAMLIVLDFIPLPPFPGGMLLRHLGVISEERFWQIARWGSLIFLVAINIPIVRGVLAVLIGLVQLPFVMLFQRIAQAGAI
ncbi:MAG: site-2 protease family protein [Opitutaceae bacterium]